jgi:hypothetical protein
MCVPFHFPDLTAILAQNPPQISPGRWRLASAASVVTLTTQIDETV